MGLFRRNRDPVGLNTETSGALGDNLSAKPRLALHTRVDADLDSLTNALADIIDCNSEYYQRFTVYKSRQEHYRLVSQIRFMYAGSNVFQNCAFYIEHPESKKLLPIVRCVRDRRFNGTAVVWLSDDPCEDTMVVPESTMMYASDEPEVAGKTLEQVRGRYGKD